MATWKVLFVLFVTTHAACNYNAEYHDTYLLCKIFEDTHVLEHYWNNSESNYCALPVFDPQALITCSSNAVNITSVDFESVWLGGRLNLDGAWPQLLTAIDLEDSAINHSEWQWSSVTGLADLWKIDLDDIDIYGSLDYHAWNTIIANLSKFTYFTSKNTGFSGDFSNITIENDHKFKLNYLRLQSNNLFGEMSIDGFMRAFPDIKYWNLKRNDITLRLDNLDILTEFTHLENFQMDFNNVSGFVRLSSDSKKLPETLYELDLNNNKMSGEVQWSIFEDSYALSILELSYNEFIGDIDWDLIGKLSKQSLSYIDLAGNNWTGFADFSSFALAEPLLNVDTTIHCNPSLYPCDINGTNATSADRSKAYCTGRSSCESTCRCSDGSVPVYSPLTTTSTSTSTTSIMTTTESNAVSDGDLGEDSVDSTPSTTLSNQAKDTGGDAQLQEPLGLNSSVWMVIAIMSVCMFCCVLCVLVVIVYIFYVGNQRVKALEKVQAAHQKQLSSVMTIPSFTASNVMNESMLHRIDESEAEHVSVVEAFHAAPSNVVSGYPQGNRLQIPSTAPSIIYRQSSSQNSEIDLASLYQGSNISLQLEEESGEHMPDHIDVDLRQMPALPAEQQQAIQVTKLALSNKVEQCNSEGKDRSQCHDRHSTMYSGVDDNGYSLNVSHDARYRVDSQDRIARSLRPNRKSSVSESSSAEDMYHVRQPTMTPEPAKSEPADTPVTENKI